MKKVSIIKRVISMCPICDKENYEGIQMLYIRNCTNVRKIPNIKGLDSVIIENCTNVSNIPIIEGLRELIIFNCSKITAIPIIEGLQKLEIINCKNYFNYGKIRFDYPIKKNEYNIKEFNMINKIKRWYKRIKISHKLWMYAELVIMDKMNPHKENNRYLERYIKDKVYN